MTVYVAVVGPGAGADETTCSTAYEVGRLLAERGALVVTGGLDGVMQSAAAGARAAGGVVVGLLPGDRHEDANPHLSVAVPTGLGELRNALLVRSAHAVICVGGSWGTLSEVALAMRTGVPVICIDGWHVVDASGAEVSVQRADDPATAVRMAIDEGRKNVEEVNGRR